MRKSYKIGRNENQISVNVIIGTKGIAQTKVFQFLPGGQYKLLAVSNAQSGNIDNAFIGNGSDLIGSYLKIRTIIDLGSIADVTQWPQLSDCVSAKFGLSGGFLGNQSYSFDEDDKTDSSSGQVIIIDMEVNLTK